ncbi:MAG: Rab family GTPase [Pyrobaculum sp.]
MAYRRVVALLGVGGVGKTTFAYRVLGVSETPVLTLRPSYYRFYIGDLEIDLVDVPGQRVFEVAAKFTSFKIPIVDRLVYMYDLTNYETLYAISEIHTIFIERGSRVAKEYVVVGNKRDIAEEIGVFIEADEIASSIGASEIYYISAVKDPPRVFQEILLGKS